MKTLTLVASDENKIKKSVGVGARRMLSSFQIPSTTNLLPKYKGRSTEVCDVSNTASLEAAKVCKTLSLDNIQLEAPDKLHCSTLTHT